MFYLGRYMFYNHNKEQLIGLGFTPEQCDRLVSKSTHRIVEKYLEKNDGDFLGALHKLLEYLNKRSKSNPYSIQHYLSQGLTLEEAEKKISDLKAKTSGSLETYISKYGIEEGTKRYSEFCSKSAHTKEKFQQKYGDEWEEKWHSYLKTKDCRSDSFFKKKYGEDWKHHRDSFVSAWSYKMSKEGMVEKHGDYGVQLYDEIQKRKSNSIENCIKKYGENIGTQKYNEANKKRAYANTIDYYVEKYGLDLGTDLFRERSKSLSFTLENQILKYGEHEGTKRYNKHRESMLGRGSLEWFIEKYGEEIGKERFKERYKNSVQPKAVSKSSILFFDTLSEYLGVDLLYGNRSSEKCLTRQNGRNFYYDCVDEYNKILFEYNGSHFHYHQSFSEDWVGYRNMKPAESIKKDVEKRELAIQAGYRFCEIWDFEVKTKTKLLEKLKQIKEDFYANSSV